MFSKNNLLMLALGAMLAFSPACSKDDPAAKGAEKDPVTQTEFSHDVDHMNATIDEYNRKVGDKFGLYTIDEKIAVCDKLIQEAEAFQSKYPDKTFKLDDGTDAKVYGMDKLPKSIANAKESKQYYVDLKEKRNKPVVVVDASKEKEAFHRDINQMNAISDEFKLVIGSDDLAQYTIDQKVAVIDKFLNQVELIRSKYPNGVASFSDGTKGTITNMTSVNYDYDQVKALKQQLLSLRELQGKGVAGQAKVSTCDEASMCAEDAPRITRLEVLDGSRVKIIEHVYGFFITDVIKHAETAYTVLKDPVLSHDRASLDKQLKQLETDQTHLAAHRADLEKIKNRRIVVFSSIPFPTESERVSHSAEIAAFDKSIAEVDSLKQKIDELMGKLRQALN